MLSSFNLAPVPQADQTVPLFPYISLFLLQMDCWSYWFFCFRCYQLFQSSWTPAFCNNFFRRYNIWKKVYRFVLGWMLWLSYVSEFPVYYLFFEVLRDSKWLHSFRQPLSFSPPPIPTRKPELDKLFQFHLSRNFFPSSGGWMVPACRVAMDTSRLALNRKRKRGRNIIR